MVLLQNFTIQEAAYFERAVHDGSVGAPSCRETAKAGTAKADTAKTDVAARRSATYLITTNLITAQLEAP